MKVMFAKWLYDVSNESNNGRVVIRCDGKCGGVFVCHGEGSLLVICCPP